MNLDKLKQIADGQKKEKAMIEGKLESLYEELEKEGHTSLDSAKGDVILLGKKITRMRKTFTDKTNQFEKKYAKELSLIL